MADSNFIIDEYLKIKEKRTGRKEIFKKILLYAAGSISLAVLYYCIGAIFISTDVERKLRRENRMFAQQYQGMVEKEKLLGDVVDGLDLKDERIYSEIFHSKAPSAYKLEDMNFLSVEDSIQDKDIVDASVRKMENVKSKASRIEENFRKAYSYLDKEGNYPPPMLLPLDNYSYVKTGASTGMKVSPFYKVETQHNGIDLLAPAGAVVKATAEGLVTDVVHSRKGQGNVVEISHRNGYRTRYAHLGDIKVKKGKLVKAGDVIGKVGMTGNSFAPHLHYEIQKDSTILDPAVYFLAGTTPSEYANILLMSASSGKSMD